MAPLPHSAYLQVLMLLQHHTQRAALANEYNLRPPRPSTQYMPNFLREPAHTAQRPDANRRDNLRGSNYFGQLSNHLVTVCREMSPIVSDANAFRNQLQAFSSS